MSSNERHMDYALGVNDVMEGQCWLSEYVQLVRDLQVFGRNTP